ncbi:ribosome maturation factor RimM [Chromatocurvus halotolerans]|nr:ribosome maturation factor RimM [Chromatocurvus halotolerans]
MPPRNQPLPEGMLAAGRITGCYGVKGWVKVHPFTEEAVDLLHYPAWWLQTRDGIRPVVLDQGRVSGKGLVVHLAGVDNRDRAEELRGQTLLVQRDELPELGDDDYYWHQLENLEVWCRDADNGSNEEVLLGRIHHLIETGANDVLVVQPCEGSIDERERLIPYLPESVVRQVELEAGRMSVDWFIDE